MSSIAAAPVPPRKRRRPALSCVECRRRKIKCDRNMPCDHCRQSKRSICTYKDAHKDSQLSRQDAQVPSAPAQPTSLQAESYRDSFNTVFGASSNSGSAQHIPFGSQQLPQSLPSLEDGVDVSRLPCPAPYMDSSAPANGDHDNVCSVPYKRPIAEIMSLTAPDLAKESNSTMSVMGINFTTFEDVMIQDGDGRNVLRTKVFKNSHSNPIRDIQGIMCKTRFFGQSHWMYALKQLPPVCRYKDPDGNVISYASNKEVREALEKCKRMARAAKAERPIKWHMNPNLKDYVPPRHIADKLVALYLRTCESIYRIVHIPSFNLEYEAYWQDPSQATLMSTVKILLIMAIGTCFYQEEGNEDLRAKAQQWIYGAQSWITSPFEKSRLNMHGIQLHCLLVLGRQTNAVGGDLIWPAAGTLLRMAFSIGLHRDPKHFTKMPLFISEMRRRLWATTLEMAIQTSLESGMPPLISPDDWDTEAPANIDDNEIWEGTEIMPPSRPSYKYTSTSLQIILVRTQRTRLKIVDLLNKFNAGPSYEEVLRLDQDITSACNDASRLNQMFSTLEHRPTAFQRNLLDILVRRFLLHIHIPFSIQSKTEPRYYYSRKVCLEAALAMFFHSGAEDLPPDHDPRIVDDFTRLKVIGGGVFKEIMLHAATIIIVDLLYQLDDDIKSGLPPSVQRKASREPLYQATSDIIALTVERIRHGENNAKGHLFLSAAWAQIQAMTNGIDPQTVVPEAAKQSALQCLELLRARTKNPPITPPDSDPGTNTSGGTESLEEQEYSFNMMIPDANLELDIPDSWVFTGWELN